MMRYLSWIFLLSVSACVAVRQPVSGVFVEEEREPELLFLFCRAVKQSDGKLRLELLDKELVAGMLKEKMPEDVQWNPGDVRCVQLDESANELGVVRVADPLVRDVEYMGAGGGFERRRIELDSADFSLRLQVNPEARSLVLNFVGSGEFLKVGL